jgi:Ca2+-binding RTX toxin-like protein
VLRGAAGDDSARGDAGNDVVDGGDGDDTLDGGDGNDTLLAGAGDDEASGGSGNDVISDGAGCDDVDGGDGNDYVQAAADGASDSYSGGDGEDTLDYSSAVLSIVVDLARGSAEGAQIGRDLISSFEGIIGGQGDDDIVAGSGSVKMTGGAGRDRFEFQVSDDDHQPDLVRQITDFSIGDRLIVASYEIRYREGEDVDDAIEDLFDDIYLSNGSENGNRPIRFRFEENDEDRRTFLDLMNDDESQSTFSIELFGHHQSLEVTVGVT